MGEPPYTLEEFRVDLQALEDAIGKVDDLSKEAKENMSAISHSMRTIETQWNSPAGDTFTEVKTWFETVQTELSDMLDDIIHRMRESHGNYSRSEMANMANVTPEEKGA